MGNTKEHRDDHEHDAGRAAAGEGAARDAGDRSMDEGFDEVRAAGRGRGSADEPGPERRFMAEGDRDANWDQFQAILDGRADASGLVALVQKMDGPQRDTVLERMKELPKAASGRDALVVADLVDAPLDVKVDTALQCQPPPPVGVLRGHLEALPVRHLSEFFADERVQALRSIYGGAPGALHSLLGEVDGELIENVEALRWYLETTPPTRAARRLLKTSAPAGDAIALNALGEAGWAWSAAVDAALVSLSPAVSATFAAEASDPAARARLAELLSAVAPAEAGLPRIEQARTAHTELQRALSEAPVDVAGVRAALAVIGAEGGADLLGKHRRALVSAASVEDLLVIGELIGLDEPARTELAMEARDADLAALAAAVGPESGRGTLYRLRDRYPDAAPRELMPGQRGELLDACTSDVTLRRWFVAHAEPEELLELVGRYADLTSNLCQWLIAEGIGLAWIHELGGGRASDTYLRRLALNCPEPDVTRFIRERLLGDVAFSGTIDNAAPQAVPDAAFADGAERLDQAHDAGRTGAEVSARVAELSATELAALRADPAALRTALYGSEDGAHVARTLVLLDLPLSDAVPLLPRGPHPEVAAYVRSRPPAEVVAVFGDDALAMRLRDRTGAGPFDLAPVLHAPDPLARALGANPGLLDWLADALDPLALLDTLSQPGMVEAGAKALARRRAMIDRLPVGQGASPRVREALAALAGAARGDVAEALRDRLDLAAEDEALDAAAQATVDRRAALDGRLWDVLAALARDPAATAADARAECLRLVADGPALVRAHDHAWLVSWLHETTQTSPRVVLPLASHVDVLSTLRGREWLFATEPGELVLAEAGRNPALCSRLGDLLDGNDAATHGWIATLASGHALSDVEQRAVAALRAATRGARSARALFRLRFGAEVTSGYSRQETVALWDTLERLPDAHIDQGAVTDFGELAEDEEFDGLYNKQKIGLGDNLVKKGDAPREEHRGPFTRAQLLRDYEMTEQELEARVASGELVAHQAAGETVYERVPVVVQRFAHVVLHEVGHAVDDMLGGHTELVFGLAGWRQFDEGDFDGWARELGGWDAIPAAEQVRIRDAWQMWLSSTTSQEGRRDPVSSLVSSEHPLLATRHQEAGVVRMARDPMNWKAPPAHGGRRWLVNHRYQELYSVPERTATVAPSEYALYAPGEFFAECYAEYYREVDGTDATRDRKGGRLAGWIKEWFDRNVDRVSFNPQRVRR